MTLINDIKDIKLNSKGTNAEIKAHILSDEEMLKIGFTSYDPDVWYFNRIIMPDLTFNVQIPKDGSDIFIDLLDEKFLQSYDYQYLLWKNPENEFALKCKEKVEDWMEYLQSKGVLSGHVRGEYI